MLSYRHGYHAGNHADILKHMILCVILRAYNLKDNPYCFIDTHAGGGIYKLDSVFASKTKEYKSGLSKIIDNQRLKELVPEFYQILASLNENELNTYPGSAYISANLSRKSDKIFLLDMHPAEIESLEQVFKRYKKVSVQRRDFKEAVNALLPPQIKRGICFIDPSYEQSNDYLGVIKNLKLALSKWKTACYVIWYPILHEQNDCSKELIYNIKRLNLPLLNFQVNIKNNKDEFGMNGSGMLIINYPYNVFETLEQITKELENCLKIDSSSSYKAEILNKKD